MITLNAKVHFLLIAAIEKAIASPLHNMENN
jgi:hypothetical protein